MHHTLNQQCIPTMNDNLVCNVCRSPGTLDDSKDCERIASNVREFRHEKFMVWRCNHCESLHIKETIDFQRYYRDYFIKRLKDSFFLRVTYKNRIKQLKRAGLAQNHAILDYGCGSGHFVDRLKKSGFDSFGYDAYSDDFSSPELLQRNYDVVTTYDVIEHVDDPREFLVEMQKLLRPGGLLLIGTPNGAAVSIKENWLPELHLPFHRHILSQKALCDLGKSLGMEVRLVDNYLHVDSLWPTCNSQFIWDYVRICGEGCIDVVADPPHVGKVLKSPRLMFYAVFGYFFQKRRNMTVVFQAPWGAR
jgi:2-polyprenyl-3-methyl-5-hydroxy-6-metoxy-1,4-benzoquinol methylase